MKKTIALLALTLFASGCSWFGKMGEIEYNNEIVEAVNELSTHLEKSATLYNETIPDLVTEVIDIDVTGMKAEADASLALRAEADALLNLEAKNLEQQNAVRTSLETYLSAGDQYLETYQVMLDYYGNGDYKNDITQVQTIDEQLHSDYTTFIQANNELVETLESFVKVE